MSPRSTAPIARLRRIVSLASVASVVLICAAEAQGPSAQYRYYHPPRGCTGSDVLMGVCRPHPDPQTLTASMRVNEAPRPRFHHYNPPRGCTGPDVLMGVCMPRPDSVSKPLPLQTRPTRRSAPRPPHRGSG
jgi:hypothetical protein